MLSELHMNRNEKALQQYAVHTSDTNVMNTLFIHTTSRTTSCVQLGNKPQHRFQYDSNWDVSGPEPQTHRRKGYL